MNLLIIDDEPLEIEQLEFLIKKRYPTWEVFAAEDAAEAKRLVQNHEFPLAFVDIQLPGDSGLDFATYIKQNHLPMEIVLITAYQNFAYAKQALKLNLMDYIVKPVIEDELYSVIDKFLSIQNVAITKSDIVNQTINIIKNRYSEKINLQMIAEIVHVNPTYLSRKFMEELGVHFKEYLIQYRVEQAKSLMRRDPTMTIARVAEETGFASQHHFSNSFKKVENVTPSRFKEKLYD